MASYELYTDMLPSEIRPEPLDDGYGAQEADHSQPLTLDDGERDREDAESRQSDRLFGWLMVGEYGLTLLVTGWMASMDQHNGLIPWLDPLVAASLGIAILFSPTLLIWMAPGKRLTRHLIAVSQFLFCALVSHLMMDPQMFVYLSFVSLAFLAFYRDWTVLLTATITALCLGSLAWIFPGMMWHYPEGASLTTRATPLLWLVAESMALILISQKCQMLVQMVCKREGEMAALNDHLSKEIEERNQTHAALQWLHTKMELQVEERTIELMQLNLALEKQLQERKRLEAQLVQAQKMESIGQLAAGVAHEINNPVGFVMSNLSTLEEYTTTLKSLILAYEHLICDVESQWSKAQISPEIQDHLGAIETLHQQEDIPFILSDIEALVKESREGTSRVQEIVRNLKSFARVDEVSHKETNIHDGIDSTLKIVWNEIKYKCQVDKQYGQLPDIYCNPSQLNQVFMNLIVNAAHAIENHGVITIETYATESDVYVKIRDNGKGISAEHLDRIFDPFFTTKPVGKGTGLGLAISYGIIKDQDGDIQVESEVGQGTCFTIRLPIRSELDVKNCLFPQFPQPLETTESTSIASTV